MFSTRRVLLLVSAGLQLLLGVAIIAFAQESQPNEPQAAKTIRKSSGELRSAAISRPEPVYPALASAAKVYGLVLVEVKVHEDGHVVSARVISGDPLLKDSAISAAKEWTFKPTMDRGVPVKVIGIIPFNFSRSVREWIEELEARLRANPSSAETHLSLAEVYGIDGRLDAAIAEYKQTITLKPDYPSAYCGLGHIYLRLKRDDSARDAFVQAMRINGGDVAGSSKGTLRHDQYVSISAFFYMHKDYQESIEVLKQAALKLPELDDISIHLGLIHLDDRLDDIRIRLGLLYLEVGDKQSALKEYNALRDKKAEWAQKLLESIER